MSMAKGPWYIRYCDDEAFQCMTVISTKDWGPRNRSQFDGEDDTVAIVYHQCSPFVARRDGLDTIDDLNERDKVARLIVEAPKMYQTIKALQTVGNGTADIGRINSIVYMMKQIIQRVEGEANEH